MKKHIKYDNISWRITKDGYYISTYNFTTRFLHRYIWQETYGKIPNGYIIHHIDQNKSNNKINNLQLMTDGEHKKYHSNGINNSMYGRKQTTRHHIICKNLFQKKVSQFNSQGFFIKTWDCISEASSELGINNIGACLKGIQKTAGGFIWRYA